MARRLSAGSGGTGETVRPGAQRPKGASTPERAPSATRRAHRLDQPSVGLAPTQRKPTRTPRPEGEGKRDAGRGGCCEQSQFNHGDVRDRLGVAVSEADRSLAILDYLEHAQPGSRDHIIFLLLWKTGARTGAIRGLDLRDVDLDGTHPRVNGPAVHFVHRPDTGTPLKNQQKGSRWNRISERTARYIADYIDYHRDDVTDDFDREPLITTEYGRPAGNTLRTTLYRVTRPCWRGEACPHDRDIDECEATHLDKASKCPSSRSPHDLRSGRVTYYRREDVPRQVVQDRLNASEDILDRHYDRRSDREQAEQRSDYLPDL